LAKEGARLSSEATSLLNPPEGIQPDSASAVRLYNQALTTFRKALELSPKDFLARIGLLAALKDQAEAYLAMQEYDLTIQNLSEALKLKPDLPLLFRRGEVYKLAGHREHACADFIEFLQTSSNSELKQRAEKYLLELQQMKSGAE
jgi:tetratricopeptide (TPR) repeat protein